MLEFLKNSGINWAEVIVALATIILTSVIVPLIRNRLSADKLEKARFIANEAVKAAEQIFDHGDNDAKYAYVAEVIAKAGIKLKPEIVKALIEAAVIAMKELAKAPEKIEGDKAKK